MCMAVVASEGVLHQAKVDIEDGSAKSLTMPIPMTLAL